MTGRIGGMCSPAEHWCHAGRDELFFAPEADIHLDDSTFARCPRTRAGYDSD